MTVARLGDLKSLIESAMSEWQIPALAIAVIVEDEPVLIEAYGMRDLEAGLVASIDTQFLLCSVTKTFTATGLGMLVDDGRLDWNRPVRDYLPEFSLSDQVAGERSTVLDLLCHRTGLPAHDWIWMSGDRSRQDMFAALRFLKPSCDFRAAFQYQNLGYVAAGMVAERITGQSWEDFTRHRIMRPLGITGFGFSIEDLQRSVDFAWPYIKVGERRERTKLWPIKATPAGGITMSLSGMTNFLRFHLGQGCFDGAQLLSPTTIRSLQTPLIHTGWSDFDEVGSQHYGLGFECHHYRGERVVRHDGGWIGWGTFMSMLPDRRIGTVILTNFTWSLLPEVLSYTVFDRLCGNDPISWLDRLRKQMRELQAKEAEEQRIHADARKSSTRPTHALADFVGEYEHPGYGRMTIELDGDDLHCRFYRLTAKLTHRHYDTFELPANPHTPLVEPLPLTFVYDRQGNINRLCTPMEPLVADIEFVRV
jgi:CubicO group peptidase (beta-lactamase class C family)